MFGSDFMYFSRPWELSPGRAFQGTGKAIKSNMGEWLQDKCLVSTSQRSKRKLVSFLREGAPKENPNKENERETEKRRDHEETDKRSVTCCLGLRAPFKFGVRHRVWPLTSKFTSAHNCLFAATLLPSMAKDNVTICLFNCLSLIWA